MDKFPVLLEGKSCGELTVEQEGLYTCFSVQCTLPEGLWCAWAIGEHNQLRLGVLEPSGKQTALPRRRFSRQLTAPIGRLLHAEVRPAGAKASELWQPAPAPDLLFHVPWLSQRLKGIQGALTRTEDSSRFLALPYDKRKPFPLTTLFCFARLRKIGSQFYAVFSFNEKDQPIF